MKLSKWTAGILTVFFLFSCSTAKPETSSPETNPNQPVSGITPEELKNAIPGNTSEKPETLIETVSAETEETAKEMDIHFHETDPIQTEIRETEPVQETAPETEAVLKEENEPTPEPEPVPEPEPEPVTVDISVAETEKSIDEPPEPEQEAGDEIAVAEEYEFVPIITLLNEAESNSFRANLNYGNRNIETAGKLDRINSNGDYFILGDYGSDFSFKDVKCVITDSKQLDMLSILNTGMVVNVKGKVKEVGGLYDYTFEVDEISANIVELASWIGFTEEELMERYEYKKTENQFGSSGGVQLELFGITFNCIDWIQNGICSLNLCGIADGQNVTEEQRLEIFTAIYTQGISLYGDPTIDGVDHGFLSDIRDDITSTYKNKGYIDVEWRSDDFMLTAYCRSESTMFGFANHDGIDTILDMMGN